MDGALERGADVGGGRHLLFRLTIGLLQGFAAAALIHAEDNKLWPAGTLYFTEAVYLAAFWPPVLLVSVSLRRATFALWSLLALGIVAALVYYGVWRNGDTGNLWPEMPLVPALAAFLFIAQSLITAASTDGRLIAHYATYFDTAWKLGLQAVMGAAFVCLLWLVLRVGAELFLLIKLDFLKRVIENKWFSFPVSTLAFAYAVDLTDVRTGLIRGVRTLALMLQSWLLPVMALLTVAFLAALPFTGLEALWATRRATALLLGAAAVIIFLINAAYRDGDGNVPGLVRGAGTIAAVALVPLVAIAAYALMLRIGQHGLTPDRVIAFFCTGIAVAFTMGYAISAVNIGGWLKGVEATNVFTAYLVLAVILALFTPLADPARISVNDQVARLSSGRIAADAFDYDFLRFKSGRYGRETLATLAHDGAGKDAAKVKELAAAAQTRTEPLPIPYERAPTPEEIAKQITVYPAGRSLPESFLKQNWSETKGSHACLTRHGNCDVALVDFDQDGTDEVVILQVYGSVFKLASDGKWIDIGHLGDFCAPDAWKALKEGRFTLQPNPLRDIITSDGSIVRVVPDCGPGG